MQGLMGRIALQTYKLPSLDFHKVATRFQLPVRAVAFSPCGLKLAAAGDDDGIKLVHVADGKVSKSNICISCNKASDSSIMAHLFTAFSPSLCPDVIGRYSQVYKTLRAGPYTRCLAFEHEGTYLASLSAEGHMHVWDVATGKSDCSMPKCAPKVCQVLPELLRSGPGLGMLIYTGSSHFCVSCPDLGFAPAQVDRSSAMRGGLAWHPNGSLLAVAGTNNSIVIYESLSWEPLHQLDDAHTGLVNCLRFSPNGEPHSYTGLTCPFRQAGRQHGNDR